MALSAPTRSSCDQWVYMSPYSLPCRAQWHPHCSPVPSRTATWELNSPFVPSTCSHCAQSSCTHVPTSAQLYLYQVPSKAVWVTSTLTEHPTQLLQMERGSCIINAHSPAQYYTSFVPQECTEPANHHYTSSHVNRATYDVSDCEGTPVFFDLETTGLDTHTCDIVQLSAISGERIFNAYVFPRCPIDYGASKVTGLTTRGQTLLLHGQRMHTVPLNEALEAFISFLGTFDKPYLVGHNARRFDSPILLRMLREFQLLHEFWTVVTGFLDTLILSREMFRLPKYSQAFLVQYFLHKNYNAHNATDDATALQDLYRAWRPSPDDVNRHKFTL